MVVDRRWVRWRGCAELVPVPRQSVNLLAGALLASCALGLAACGASYAPTTRSASATPTARATTTFASVPLSVPAGQTAAPFDQPRTLQLPPGWTAAVWARVDDARLEAWTPQRHLLVSSPQTGSVIELTPKPDGSAAQRAILGGLTNPQGLAFDRVGGHEVLYVAESNELDRYRWSHGRPGARTVLVHDLPDTQPAEGDVHRLKNVVVGASHTIYVDIGSSSNANLPTFWHGTPRAAVIAYRPNGTRQRVFATGVRNGDGLAFAPDGTLWTAVNERDQITYPFRRAYGSTASAYGKVIAGYVNDHPAEELARLTAGRNLGWPYCNPDPDVQPGVAGTRLNEADMRFDPDSVTNPGSSRLNCARLARVQRGLPAHSAPLGFHFLQGSRLPSPWANGAVVAAHGSWDRQPPRAPVVYWLPWRAKGRTLGPATTLVSGFQQSDGTRWGRTADAVPGPDGALYVTDDTAGAVYRIVPAR
jgi:glucose/arabinose dehydrogenase